jgi:hypothetical protein
MVKAYFTTEEILNKINEILKDGGKTIMEAPVTPAVPSPLAPPTAPPSVPDAG